MFLLLSVIFLFNAPATGFTIAPQLQTWAMKAVFPGHPAARLPDNGYQGQFLTAGRSLSSGVAPIGRPSAGGVISLRSGPLLSASADVKIKAPMEVVWSKISDFEGMPQWMPWIHSVKTLPDGVSKWTLRKRILKVPLQFSWTAQEGEQIPHRLIHWEARTGLENRGKIELDDWEEDGEHWVRVTMTISYRMPTIVAKIFREDAKSGSNRGVANRTIEKILRADLRRLKADIEGVGAAAALEKVKEAS